MKQNKLQGGWGDVNVPWKRYVTYAGVGVGGGWGDVNVPWKRYVTYAGVGVGGVAWVGYGDRWGDVNVRVNLHAFCTLRRSRCLGWVWGWVG